MKKALDQTLRDLKRGVNKKVLKVPGIEQKVLDATSNEPWGPHGSHLADIAQATRNYHEYQMIMAVLWKRINDTGKNWRHVYKALTVLEYLVANGSERVIDEIKEHAYQISTLSDFQYVDHNGRDQGNNVRKKSQSIVILVNDKERIEEVRQKASVNREKFRTTSATGGMYRPGSYSSAGGYGDDDRLGYREDDRNGYGREREWGREDDRYGRGVDPYSRDGDRYGRDSDDRYGRDGYREDDNRGRSRSTDDYQYGSRSRSSDGYRDRSYDDDGRFSSRSSGARPEDSQDERRLERKFSEQNIGAPPPPYEEATSDNRSPVHDEREGDIAEAPAPKEPSPTGSVGQSPSAEPVGNAAPHAPHEFGGFDEFDPRGPVSVTPPPAHNGEVDFLGSLSDSFSSNALALLPATSATSTPEAEVPVSSGSGPTFVALSSASTVLNQPVQDPFGDSPFKATPTTDNIPNQSENAASTSNFQPTAMAQTSEPSQQAAPNMETTSFDFGDTFSGITYTPSSVDNMEFPSSNLQLALPDPSVSNQNMDILADILPPSGSSAPPASHPTYTMPGGQYVQHPAAPQSSFLAPGGQFGQQSNFHGNFNPQGGYTGQPAPQGHYTDQPSPQGGYYTGQPAPQGGYNTGQPAPQGGYNTGQPAPQGGYYTGQPAPQGGYYTGQPAPQGGYYAPNSQPVQQNNNVIGNLPSQTLHTASATSHYAPATTGISVNKQSQKKFETKSTVWADTLSKGLVDLNISGPKTNPLADIGVDFESINRREKRERPPSTTTVTSTITMGKAMGSGSGIGRAGASSLGPPSTPGMGMSGGAGMGMGTNMVNFGGMNQPMGMGMGVGQGGPMRPPTGVSPGNYNPMIGQGGYPQQPYGGYK